MRLARAILLVASGALTALATVAVHQLWWGFLLAAAATVTALIGLGGGWLTRLPFGLGWTGFVGWVAFPRPEGDFAVSSDLPGYALLAMALLVLVYAVVTLPRPRRVRSGTVRGAN